MGDRATADGGINRPRATYRLQLGPSFGFDAATAIVGYLSRLGVSHLYLSPISESVQGSTHGYDVVDPTRIRQELGGDEAFHRLVVAAKDCGLDLIIDIVPHHLSVHQHNKWWWDVLHRGEASQWASWFDIDWDSPIPDLKGRVLLAVLGDHFGRELAAGRLYLARDQAWLMVRYGDHAMPLDPTTTSEFLTDAAIKTGDVPLGFAGRAMNALECVTDVDYARLLAAERLEANQEAAEYLDKALRDTSEDFDALDELLSRQNYRLAHWSTADAELDYRRFFDVDSLVALRTERDDVFWATHHLPIDLVNDGSVAGLRIDHVDGLRDPALYLSRLRAAVGEKAWLLVEKIRPLVEPLPDWPVDGTTGYETIAAVTGILLDPAGYADLEQKWVTYTGADASYAEVALTARREMAGGQLRCDVERVVAVLASIRYTHRRWRDLTRIDLATAMVEVAVQMSVYRAYVVPGTPVSAADHANIESALQAARSVVRDVDSEVFELIRSLLLGQVPGVAAVNFVARFQQLTGPLAAKGEEDTALYRFAPCLAACEVGTNPGHAVLTVEQYHDWCGRVIDATPQTMATTSTHDTKRSEDVRARLALLTQMPDRFVEVLTEWEAAAVRALRGPGPTAADRWFLFQTTVGAWPIDGDRLWTAIRKSQREAKAATSWTTPNLDYESVVERWCRATTEHSQLTGLVGSLVSVLEEPGEINSLTTVVLRVLGPGVPDTYQGTERFELSLVDPDNRRPVNFDDLAADLDRLGTQPLNHWWQDLAERFRGMPKLALLNTLLELRRDPEADVGPFSSYEPLMTETNSILAFRRGRVIAAVPRFPMKPLSADAWVDVPAGDWLNLGTKTLVQGGRSPFDTLRSGFPVVVMRQVN